MSLTHQSWADNRSYLMALDLFNHGYYWEAHEEWERLCRVSGQDSLPGRFLKGLIKLSAAGVKVRENSVHGVRRHAASAGEVFADVAAKTRCSPSTTKPGPYAACAPSQPPRALRGNRIGSWACRATWMSAT